MRHRQGTDGHDIQQRRRAPETVPLDGGERRAARPLAVGLRRIDVWSSGLATRAGTLLVGHHIDSVGVRCTRRAGDLVDPISSLRWREAEDGE